MPVELLFIGVATLGTMARMPPRCLWLAAEVVEPAVGLAVTVALVGKGLPVPVAVLADPAVAVPEALSK